MNCPKCGEEYRPGQSFCLRCGAAIYENNKPLQNDNDNERKRPEEVQVPFEDIIGGISMDEEDDEDLHRFVNRDLSRIRKVEPEILDDEDEFDDEKPIYRHNNSKRKKKKSSKKKIVIISVISIIVVIATIISVLFITRAENEKKYNKYYEAGMAYYNEENYAKAITQFISAADYATTNLKKIEAYEKLWSSCEQQGDRKDEEIRALNELIKLDPNEITYYQALIIVYQNNDMDSEIEDLIDSVKDPNMKSELENFDGTIPNPSIEAGEYNKPIEISLSVSGDVTVYYTLDGTDVTEKSTKYTGNISFKKEGTYILKALSVDENGKHSKQLVAKYKLVFTVVTSPSINLDSGTYNKQTKISATADPDCTIYYTTNGKTPTDRSTKYQKEFKMLKGNNVYSFVAINSEGVSSKVVTRVYDFEETYARDYNQALSALSSALVADNTLENESGEFKNGDVMYFSYSGIKKIDNERYYIIIGTIETKENTVVSLDTYAVSCDTMGTSGGCYKAVAFDDTYSLSELTE